MADFAPNFTPRYKVRYSSLGATHTMQFRISRGSTNFTGIATKVGAFLAAIQSTLFDDWTVLGALGAFEDSDIFLPVEEPANPTGAIAVPTVLGVHRPLSISFPGRSILGQRAILYLYGAAYFPVATVATHADYRLTSAENAPIAAAITALNELSPAIVGNDDATVVWYQYANQKINDHWLRKARQG